MGRSALMMVMAFLVSLLAMPARAEFPDRPITVLIAFDVGGSTDALARMLAPYMEKHLGKDARIHLVFRPGAGGEAGFRALAEAPPDGYTIGFINTPNVVTVPIGRRASYRLSQLDPLVNVVDDPCVWVVTADSPFQTLADLIAYARANPGLLTLGSTGMASDDHLTLLHMERVAGVKLRHVPFPGGGSRYRALETRRLAIAGMNLGEALSYRADGHIRILGMMSTGRWAVAPDIPTATELGYPVVMGSMRGLAAPIGVPPPIRQKLVAALSRAVTDPDFVAEAARPQTFQALRYLDSAAFANELSHMDKDFRVLWRPKSWTDG